ncbi:hypothetical protein NIES2100_14550 [Calothrix sp. NIES-2100]|uniref:hypothetical protein n=1 Tax=Calothrix sp. NIES-2100 TaxID=1954172 RepID=UPI000B60E08F|nr:hypothetical protein NIES2100_14550 [Calothrix sp. NIES-2100]
MQELIDQLQAIETLLENVTDSPEYLKLLEADCYSPDITLGDSLQGVRQALSICRDGKQRIPYSKEFTAPGAIA